VYRAETNGRKRRKTMISAVNIDDIKQEMV